MTGCQRRRALCRGRRLWRVTAKPSGAFMKPLRIRIDRVVDFGTIVSLIGVDIEAGKPVTIHIDHRPFASFWEAWREAGFPQPIEYAADQLMLHLDMLPDEEANEVRLIECSGTTIANTNDEGRAVREIEP